MADYTLPDLPYDYGALAPHIDGAIMELHHSKHHAAYVAGVNQAIEQMGLATTQRLATVFDGITRHSPEGINFKTRAEEVGWKQAVDERDRGTFDWTANRPINAPK